MILFLPSEHEAHVYVIRRGGPGNPVKIGFSMDPYTRMRQLQVGVPERLELVFCAPGGRDFEKHLHAIYEKERISGEWFTPSEYMAEGLKSQFLVSAWDALIKYATDDDTFDRTPPKRDDHEVA